MRVPLTGRKGAATNASRDSLRHRAKMCVDDFANGRDIVENVLRKSPIDRPVFRVPHVRRAFRARARRVG
jgi:hypothetical protein